MGRDKSSKIQDQLEIHAKEPSDGLEADTLPGPMASASAGAPPEHHDDNWLPDPDDVRERTGLHPYQQCTRVVNGKKCGSWNTISRSTQRKKLDDGRIVATRYRYCKDCKEAYQHVTFLGERKQAPKP